MLADGTQRRVDADHDPELYWAVRGAGAGLGAVTAFEIEATELRQVRIAQLAFDADPGGEALMNWASAMALAPRELSTAGMLVPNGAGFATALTAVVAHEDPDFVNDVLQPLLTGPGLLQARAQIAPYTALVPTGHLHANVGQMSAHTANVMIPDLAPTVSLRPPNAATA